MTTYRVTLEDGQTFLMAANLAQASAPISANFHGGEEDWQLTPYQTADARHREFAAARLVAEYFSTGEDDHADVEDVDVIDEEDDQ